MSRQPTENDIRRARAILARRLRAGVTQRELGTALGVSAQQVSKFERAANIMSAEQHETALAFLAAEEARRAGRTPPGFGEGAQAGYGVDPAHQPLVRVLQDAAAAMEAALPAIAAALAALGAPPRPGSGG